MPHNTGKIRGIHISLGAMVSKSGQTGGQTINGDINANGTLTLNSTSHATKGSVKIEDDGTNVLLEIKGSDRTIIPRGTINFDHVETPLTKDTITTGLSGTIDVYVVDGFAYVLSKTTAKLSIFDISDPDNIIVKDSITTGLTAPVKVIVLGKYAYVVDATANSLNIFDVSDPTSIVAKDSITTNLSGPGGVSVLGKYAYVINFTSSTLSIYDISDPNNIIARGTISTGLNLPRRIYVIKEYAYVTSGTNDTLAIFDVRNSDTPTAKGTITTGISGPTGIHVIDRYAYLVSQSNNTFLIFDVSDPTSIVAKGTTTTNLSTPREVVVAGKYAYISNQGNNTISMYDISNPSSIVAKGVISSGLSNPQGLYLIGQNLYVASQNNNTLAIFEITHLDASSIKSGTIEVDHLDVKNKTQLSGLVNINNSLTVGGTSKFDNEVAISDNINHTSGFLDNSVTATITASVTQTQGQQPLTSTVNEVSTVANANDTVTMPPAIAGRRIVIINNGANILQVFPASGDDLGSGVDTAVTIASGSNSLYQAYDDTNWQSMIPGANTFLGEMTAHSNATVTAINTLNVEHAITIFSTGDLANFTFQAGISGVIANTANNGGVLRCTDVAHGLTTGDIVTLTGMGDALHNGITAITKIDNDTFDCDNIVFNSTADTGIWDRGDALIASAGATRQYAITNGISASSASANQIFDFHIYKGITRQNKTAIKRKFANSDVGALSKTSFITIAASDILWFSALNETAANGITIIHGNVSIHKI